MFPSLDGISSKRLTAGYTASPSLFVPVLILGGASNHLDNLCSHPIDGTRSQRLK